MHHRQTTFKKKRIGQPGDRGTRRMYNTNDDEFLL
jgi:hypothetical protein